MHSPTTPLHFFSLFQSNRLAGDSFSCEDQKFSEAGLKKQQLAALKRYKLHWGGNFNILVIGEYLFYCAQCVKLNTTEGLIWFYLLTCMLVLGQLLRMH